MADRTITAPYSRLFQGTPWLSGLDAGIFRDVNDDVFWAGPVIDFGGQVYDVRHPRFAPLVVGSDWTAAVNAAAQVAGDAGGGVVFVPEGLSFVSGSLVLPAGVTLRVGSTAVTGRRLDVREFGAVGNGTVDDTAATIDAVAAMAPGDALLFPSGLTFLLSSSITKSSVSNLHFIATGATIKTTDMSLTGVFDFTSCDRLSWEGGHFLGTEDDTYFQANSPTEERSFLKLSLCERAAFNNITGEKKRRLITADACDYLTVDGIKFEGFLQDLSLGAVANGKECPAVTIKRCDYSNVSDIVANNCGSALLGQLSSEHVTVSQIRGHDLHDNGVYCSSGFQWTVDDVIIKDCVGNAVQTRGANMTVKNVIGVDLTDYVVDMTGLGLSEDAWGADADGYNLVASNIAGLRCIGAFKAAANTYYPRDVVASDLVAYDSIGTGTNPPVQIIAVSGVHLSDVIIRTTDADFGVLVGGVDVSNPCVGVTVDNAQVYDVNGSAAGTRGGVRVQFAEVVSVDGCKFGDIASGIGVRLLTVDGATIMGNQYPGGQVVRAPTGETNVNLTVIGNRGATLNLDPTSLIARDNTNHGGLEFHVKLFGVVGDGVAIDTTDLQAAIAAAAAVGATLVFSPGTYLATDLIASGPLSIVGHGATLKRPDNSLASDWVLDIQGDGSSVDGITIDANAAGNVGHTSRSEGLRISGDDVVVDGVTAKNTPTGGTQTANTFYVSGENVHLLDCISRDAGYAAYRIDGDRCIMDRCSAIDYNDKGVTFNKSGADLFTVTDFYSRTSNGSNAAGFQIDPGTLAVDQLGEFRGRDIRVELTGDDAGSEGIKLVNIKHVYVDGFNVVQASTAHESVNTQERVEYLTLKNGRTDGYINLDSFDTKRIVMDNVSAGKEDGSRTANYSIEGLYAREGIWLRGVHLYGATITGLRFEDWSSLSDSESVALTEPYINVDGATLVADDTDVELMNLVMGASNITPGKVVVTGLEIVTGSTNEQNHLTGSSTTDALIQRNQGTSLMERVFRGNAAPTANAWKVGDRVYDWSPTAGAFIGWICTSAGTPGTWKTFGAISA